MAKKRANGEGNIQNRKDGRWAGRYTAGYDQDGKWFIKNVLGRTQAEVKVKLSVAIAECQHLDVSHPREYTVAKWLRLWFKLYAKPNIRPSTAGYYCRAMEEYTIPWIGNTKLNKFANREIQKQRKRKPSQRVRGTGHPHHAAQCPGPSSEGVAAAPKPR